MKRQQTTFHFNVKIKAPAGVNGQLMQQFLREAVMSYAKGTPPGNPFDVIEHDDFTVALVKKEVVYGQR